MNFVVRNLLLMRYNFKLLLRSLWPNAINMLSECYRNATRMNLYAINEISMGHRYATNPQSKLDCRITQMLSRWPFATGYRFGTNVLLACYANTGVVFWIRYLLLMRYQLAMNKLSMCYCAFCSCYQYRPRVILERY